MGAIDEKQEINELVRLDLAIAEQPITAKVQIWLRVCMHTALVMLLFMLSDIGQCRRQNTYLG